MFRSIKVNLLCILLLVNVLGVAPPLAFAVDARVAGICDSAAVVAARETGVPLDVLRAISLTETGRKSRTGFAPWPWTVNMEGVGKWFDDLNAAQSYVDRHFSRGARSFDVGCFQINFKWHGQAFSSVEEMFEPIANARYAARFLSELHREFGDWSKAAGAYHSRTPKYARRYTKRFDRIREGLSTYIDVPKEVPRENEDLSPKDTSVRRNTYPFFVLAQQNPSASLVPLQSSSGSLVANRTARPIVEIR